jgi:hypothetical protein
MDIADKITLVANEIKTSGKKPRITFKKHRRSPGLVGVGEMMGGFDVFIDGEKVGDVSPFYMGSDLVWSSNLFAHFGLVRWRKLWKTKEAATKMLKAELKRQMAELGYDYPNL